MLRIPNTAKSMASCNVKNSKGTPKNGSGVGGCPTWLDQGHFVQQPLEDVELASPIGALLVYLIKARNRSGGWIDEEYRLISTSFRLRVPQRHEQGAGSNTKGGQVLLELVRDLLRAQILAFQLFNYEGLNKPSNRNAANIRGPAGGNANVVWREEQLLGAI